MRCRSSSFSVLKITQPLNYTLPIDRRQNKNYPLPLPTLLVILENRYINQQPTTPEQSAMTQLQWTIKSCGLLPLVNVAKMPSDDVECEECGKTFLRSELNTGIDFCKACGTACEECSEVFRDTEINSETDCCKACTDANFTACEECSEVFRDTEINDDTDCCEDCTDEKFSSCDECGELHTIDDIQRGEGNNSDTYYCDSCYNDNHVQCESCAETLASESATISESSDTYCEECYQDFFFWCDRCEAETSIDEYNEDSLCNDCAPSNNGEECDENDGWLGTSDYNKIGSPRKFGIELESHHDGNYSEWIGDTDWGAKNDGSTCGKEFVSPPMWGNDGYDSVMDFCDRATESDISGNHKCGFHLHIDLSDTNPEQRKAIALAYHYTRKLWSDFIAKDRRDTMYAAHSSGSEHSHAIHGGWSEDSILSGDDYPTGGHRYLWLNWQAYCKFGTVEIRSHEPTFDGQTVINWIKAHTLFVDHITTLSVGEVTRIFGTEQPDELIDTLRNIWPTDLADHYIGKMHLTEMGA